MNKSTNFSSDTKRVCNANQWKGVPDNLEDYQGFVYIIQHRKSKVYYIGKKNYWKILRRKPLKGTKRVRRCRVETDWKKYWGSSDKFKEYIKKEGKDKFDRIILKNCYTKSEMSYQELLEQINKDVLNDPNSFNGIIHARLTRTR